MRVPTRSAGTRSGVNCRRLNEPPSTSETVLTVRVLARPGTPSSRTCPPASSATITRSSIASWPTITRLISNSAVSSASWASRAGDSRGLVEASASPACRARSRRSSAVTVLSPWSKAAMSALLAGLIGAGAERDGQRLLPAGARHHDLHGIAGLAREHRLAQIGRGGDAPAVERSDHVADLQTGLLGGAARDLLDLRAVVRGGVGGGDAEPRASDVPVGLQLRDDRLDRVDRHREADARVGVRAVGGDLRVDPDHAAGGVEQRAARVAGVDRGVGLDRARDGEAVGRLDVAAQRGDDAARHGALEPERAADGDRGLARLELTGVGERERLQATLDLGGVD